MLFLQHKVAHPSLQWWKPLFLFWILEVPFWNCLTGIHAEGVSCSCKMVNPPMLQHQEVTGLTVVTFFPTLSLWKQAAWVLKFCCPTASYVLHPFITDLVISKYLDCFIPKQSNRARNESVKIPWCQPWFLETLMGGCLWVILSNTCGELVTRPGTTELGCWQKRSASAEGYWQTDTKYKPWPSFLILSHDKVQILECR